MSHSPGPARAAQLALLFVAFTAPLLSTVATRVYAVAFPLVALFFLPLFLQQRGWRQIEGRPVAAAVALLAIAALTGPSEIVAKAHSSALGGLIMLLAMLFTVVLPTINRRTLGALLATGMALAVGVITYEYKTDAGLNKYLSLQMGKPVPHLYDLDRAIVGLSLLFWPLLAGGLPTKAGRWSLLALPLAALLIAQTSSQSALLGFVLGSVVFLLALSRPLPMANLLRLAIPLMILLAPAFMVLAFPWLQQHLANIWPDASSDIRLNIWHSVALAALQWPGVLMGHGIEAARLLPVCAEGGISHPHNGPLQIWYEFGVPGALLAAYVMRRLVSQIATWPRTAAACALAALVAGLTIFSVGYNIWQLWMLGLFGFTALLLRVAVKSD